MLTLNSNKRRNNIDLFFKLVPNRFCLTQGFMSVIEIIENVDRVFIMFALLLYNMQFFLHIHNFLGVQWLSGRVLDSRPKGRGFEPHWRHCVVVLEQDTFILA